MNAGGTNVEQVGSLQYVRFGVSYSSCFARNSPTRVGENHGPVSIGMGWVQHRGGRNGYRRLLDAGQLTWILGC